ncbi:ABC transporter permease subunit [Mangrovicoccus ximenensis]|uniref:ABC transporter permease subunit n=1 Tax=Mangrovicoccus ximenensis TaxID=1911570 RepID=UPI0013752EF3|nr:branched-chain amino acid ABC transporter permease [Mangrovicoccus ximenensis]
MLRGHGNSFQTRSVLSAVFSPDGRRDLTGSDDGTARVWEAAVATELAVLRGHGNSFQTRPVLSAVFSPDGRRVLTVLGGGTARVREAATGAELAVLRGHESYLRSAVFSPDGRRVLTVLGGGTARVREAATGAELAVLRGHESYLRSAVFSPDGRRVLTGSDDGTVIATRMAVFAIAALSLDLILGFGALVSFGHAAYLGLGAYAVAICARHGVTDLFVQMAVGAAAAAAFAAASGAISLRTRGIYFIMITLAFGQMAYFFFVSLSAYGGDDGTALAARSTLLGQDWLENDTVFFYVVLGCLAATYGGLHRLVNARFGRVLAGTRESELRMRAIGYRPFRYRLAAYVISGMLCAVAGVLLANQTEYVAPAYMAWTRSGELIVMLLLGGIGTLSGALAGALVTVGLEELLSDYSEHWRLAFGLILLAVVLWSPAGLTGLVRRLRPEERP